MLTTVAWTMFNGCCAKAAGRRPRKPRSSCAEEPWCPSGHVPRATREPHRPSTGETRLQRHAAYLRRSYGSPSPRSRRADGRARVDRPTGTRSLQELARSRSRARRRGPRRAARLRIGSGLQLKARVDSRHVPSSAPRGAKLGTERHYARAMPTHCRVPAPQRTRKMSLDDARRRAEAAQVVIN